MYIVTCDEEDMGCNGGEAESAWRFISESGLPTNSCQPYTIPTCPPEVTVLKHIGGFLTIAIATTLLKLCPHTSLCSKAM